MVRSSLALSFLLAALLQTAFAAQRGKAALDMQQGRGALATSEVRPFAASAEAESLISVCRHLHVTGIIRLT